MTTLVHCSRAARFHVGAGQRLAPLSGVVAVVVALAVPIGGCLRVEDASTRVAPKVESVYDPETRRLTLLRVDADRNGTAETRSHMSGNRVVRIEVDTDEDGLVDRWEHYAPDQTLTRVGFSRARDGYEDAWSYADASGQITRIEISATRDGRVTRTEHFADARLTRVEEDADQDGHIDRWEAYEAGRLTQLSFDTSGAGRPTSTLMYLPDGSVEVRQSVRPSIDSSAHRTP